MSLLRRARMQGRKFLNYTPTRVGGLTMMFKILPLYLSNKEERVPKTPIGPFTTDPSLYATTPPTGLRVTWFGHSSLLIELEGTRILIDPVWDERASPATWFGPKRFYAPTLRLEDLPALDVILLSHDHYDHLGKATIQRLSKAAPAAGARWVTSRGVGTILQAFGVSADRVRELDWTDTLSVAGVQITALPARHFSGRSLTNRFETLWSSFVLKSPRHTVYYGADTGWWEGFTEIGQTYGPFDLSLIEIGAFNEMWKDIHLGPDGAVEAFQALGGHGLLMPIHWGLFDLALHAWRQPIDRVVGLAAERNIPLFTPLPGEPTNVLPGTAHRTNWWRPA
jgi:L-ascorbate metabolism protein UlaG (beta-lactamase superfamily)